MFSINMAKVEIPVLKETKAYRGNYYLAGQNNKWFVDLIYLYENSSIHNSFLNNFTQKVVGSGLIGDDDNSELIINKMDLNKTLAKITLDYAIYGGYCVEIIWNTLHTKILKINYLDFSKIAVGYIDEETDKVEFYYYSHDWTAYHKKTKVIQTFNPDENYDNRQIYYYKGEHPGTEIYPRPSYLGGIRYIYTDIELAKYYANLVKNNFIGNNIINIPNGENMNADKREKFEKGIKDNLTGSDGTFTLVVYDTSENGIQLLEFGKGADDAKYQWISQFTMDQLVISHRIPNPIIAGVRVPGSLGGTEEMEVSENIYNKNVIYPGRKNATEWINDMNTYFLNPITYTISDIPLFNKVEEKEIEENGDN